MLLIGPRKSEAASELSHQVAQPHRDDECHAEHQVRRHRAAPPILLLLRCGVAAVVAALDRRLGLL